MSLSERIVCLGIGFILGYVVARLREMQEKADTVDTHKRTERGFMRIPVVADALYILALIVVLWSAFSAQKAVNNAQDTQDKLEVVTKCNRVYLGAFLEAVEPRTSANQTQANDNVELQKAWYEFVQFQLHIPPYPEGKQREKANEYAGALKEFVKTSDQAQNKVAQNPYPTEQQLDNCIHTKENQDE